MQFITNLLVFIEEWFTVILIVGFVIDQIVKLTPTEKDDNVWTFVKNLLINIYQFISLPNRKRGGGTHKSNLWHLAGGLLKRKNKYKK